MRKYFSLFLIITLIILSGNIFTSSLFGGKSTILSHDINAFSQKTNLEELHDFDENKYSHYHFISENEFYYVNLETNKIEYYKDTLVTSFGEYGNTDGKFTEIKFFKVLQNGEFVILDSLNRLQFFDPSFNHLKTIQHIQYNTSFVLLGNVSSITSDIYSNIYLLDYTNGFVLKATSQSQNFEIIKECTLNSTAQITLLNSTSEIVILLDNKIYAKESTKEFQNAKSIFSDALNFIYLVTNNKIIKLNFNLETISEIEINTSREYNINLVTGTIFYIENNRISSITSFASDITSYTPPVDALSESLLTNKIELFYINKATSLLLTPYSNTSNIKLDLNTQVLVLGETIEFEINFYYVLYLDGNDYHLGYIEKRYLTKLELETCNYHVTPIRNDIKYFKYPTINVQLFTSNLTYGESYQVTREINLNNLEFVEIFINSNYIYVLKNEMLNTDSNYINLYLSTNAKLKLYGNIKEINIYDDEDKSNIIITLDKTTNVKIISSLGSLTKVSFIYENEIITGFVENKFIVKEQSFTIPITIILVLICIILLAVIIFKFRKDSTESRKKF